MKVTKRNGQLVEFERTRIVNALIAAFKACDEEVDEREINNLVEEIDIWDNISVEDIQDQVEEVLMDYGYNNVAKEYILYREDRRIARAHKDALISEVKVKLLATDVQNQNANVDERSFGGRLGEATRVVTKDYALNYLMSEMARNNHINNEIYIHDLDSYAVGMHNCLSCPLDDLLAKGVMVRQCDIRPARSINTAFQLVAVLFQLQSLQQFGGISATHLDWTMVPYLRLSFRKHYNTGLLYIANAGIYWRTKAEDMSIENTEYKCNPKVYKYAMDMTIKELEQAVEGLYHNLNSLQSRSGCQLPFSSINYGTCTLLEGRLVIKALLEGSLKGVGKFHRTSIFPCSIFQLMSGVNKEPGTPNYDLKLLALKSTAKRLYPNYANVDWSGNAGYDKKDPRTYFSTMGK